MGVSFSRSQNGTRYPYFYCIGRQKRKNCTQTFVPMETIEQAAIDYWHLHVGLDEQRTAEIRKVVMHWLLTRQAQSGKTIAAERRRVEKLDREQAKLTQAYLADALPLDVLKAEQERIQRELAQARMLIAQYQEDYQVIEAALDEALLMCRYGALAYEYAEREVRRQLIQAAFDKLWVVGAEIAGCDLKPGYIILLDEELIAELESQAGQSQHAEPDEPDSSHVHYRRAPSPARQPVLTASTATIERITAERPAGRLPLGNEKPQLIRWGLSFERSYSGGRNWVRTSGPVDSRRYVRLWCLPEGGSH
jgi:site-specific DNA recombinase